MSKIYKIPVTYEMYGYVNIQAESAEEALEKFDMTEDDFDLPKGYYLDGSFQRGTLEDIKDLNNEEI